MFFLEAIALYFLKQPPIIAKIFRENRTLFSLTQNCFAIFLKEFILLMFFSEVVMLYFSK